MYKIKNWYWWPPACFSHNPNHCPSKYAKAVCHLCRITEWTSSCGKSGMTLGWRIVNTQIPPLTWTRPCWTPYGSPTSSLPTKKEPTSMMSPQTTSCCGSSRMGLSFIVSGEVLDMLLHQQENLKWLKNRRQRFTWELNSSVIVRLVDRWKKVFWKLIQIQSTQKRESMQK